MGKRIHTIGHSTYSIEHFIGLLKAFAIEVLVDVRRYPGSRRYPHFNSEEMAKALPASGIGYHHMVDLGGRRSPKRDSPNSAWRNTSFRGYADYMQTDAFQRAVKELQELASEKSVAIMCSEAVWWSCHRALVSDYLKWLGWEVLHIVGPAREQPHPYTSPARITDEGLTYRPQNELF